MSNHIPYGNKGPDLRVRFTKRLAFELRNLVNGRYPRRATPPALPPDVLDELRRFVLELSAAGTGVTVNLGIWSHDVVVAVRLCLASIESFCTHTQVKLAAKKRRRIVEDYLGLSAVDRLAEVI